MADAEAKQIIFFDEEKKLRLNKVELERILNQEHVRGLPIAILSVIGGAIELENLFSFLAARPLLQS